MSQFKAIIKSSEPDTLFGCTFNPNIEYQCYVKQDPLPIGEQPTEDIPTFIEIYNTETHRIGLLLADFLKHFTLMAKCEYCGKWFEVTYPSSLCDTCMGMLHDAYSKALDGKIDNPENYKRLKDRFKD